MEAFRSSWWIGVSILLTEGFALCCSILQSECAGAPLQETGFCEAHAGHVGKTDRQASGRAGAKGHWPRCVLHCCFRPRSCALPPCPRTCLLWSLQNLLACLVALGHWCGSLWSYRSLILENVKHTKGWNKALARTRCPHWDLILYFVDLIFFPREFNGAWSCEWTFLFILFSSYKPCSEFPHSVSLHTDIYHCMIRFEECVWLGRFFVKLLSCNHHSFQKVLVVLFSPTIKIFSLN